MAQQLPVGQVVTLAVEGRTASNQKAVLPATPMWNAAPPGFLTLTPAADGLTCVVTAVAAGDCTLEVSCAAIPPETYDVSVLPGAAVRLVVKVM
jgi:hypothetical protein